MPYEISVSEKNNGRDFSPISGTVQYLIFARDTVTKDPVDFDVNEAIDELLLLAPEEWTGTGGATLYRMNPDVVDVCVGVYEATVPYWSPDQITPRRSNGIQYQFNLNSELTHLNYSLGATEYTLDDNDVTQVASIPFGHAVNYTDEGIEGYDKLVATASFSLSYRAGGDIFTAAYLSVVESVVGKVNSTYFKGHEPGTVLFTGAQGAISTDGTFSSEITFNFAWRANSYNMTIAGIDGIDKLGWQYMWVSYGKAVVGNFVVPAVIAVFVEDVYEYADLEAILNLPAYVGS